MIHLNVGCCYIVSFPGALIALDDEHVDTTSPSSDCMHEFNKLGHAWIH
jgi:hypothetical protein